MSDAELREAMIISSDPGEHVERIRQVEELGATTVPKERRWKQRC